MISKGRLIIRSVAISVMIGSLLALGPINMPQASKAELDESDDLQEVFEEAAKEFNVPQEVLMSVAYNETRWDHHNGEPSTSGGYGIMHLTQVENEPEPDAKGEGSSQEKSGEKNKENMNTLDEAADLIDENPEALKTDPIKNIRGGAALLAQYAEETVGETPRQASEWYGAVTGYSSSTNETLARDFADQVYAKIAEGAERTIDGQDVLLEANNVKPDKDTADSLDLNQSMNSSGGLDCPEGVDCEYIPAAYEQFSDSERDYGNYDLAERPDDDMDIRSIVIHDTEGSFDSAVDWFQDQSYASANYVIRSSDGKIAEMVKPEDAAWQAGNWYFNTHSVGIEHEGFAVDGATWYSEPMYQSSAELVKYLAERYDIPLDREHIFGHDNIPGLTPSDQTDMHWDPGTFWDWDHYFDLLGAEEEEEPYYEDESWEAKGVVAIQPEFDENKPLVTYQGEELESQPANFVYLRTEPDEDASLIGDPAIHPDGAEGTTEITDWGDKAVSGQHFYRTDRDGDWSAIDYAGEKAWFYDPQGKNTELSKGMVITPKEGEDSIPVYGAAYPEDSAYEGTGIDEEDRGEIEPLQYEISARQKYLADGPFQSDYYYSKVYDKLSDNQVVKGDDVYYQISFNHRLAFVKKSDVDIVTNSVDDIESVVTNFDHMDEFDNDQTVHDLQMHLEAVSHFEQEEKTEKVIKHLKSFKKLLKHENERDAISSDVYETLKSVTESLIDKKEEG